MSPLCFLCLFLLFHIRTQPFSTPLPFCFFCCFCFSLLFFACRCARVVQRSLEKSGDRLVVFMNENEQFRVNHRFCKPFIGTSQDDVMRRVSRGNKRMAKAIKVLKTTTKRERAHLLNVFFASATVLWSLWKPQRQLCLGFRCCIKCSLCFTPLMYVPPCSVSR